jgi:hypothetical protein
MPEGERWLGLYTEAEMKAKEKNIVNRVIEIIHWFDNVEDFTTADIINRIRATTGE